MTKFIFQKKKGSILWSVFKNDHTILNNLHICSFIYLKDNMTKILNYFTIALLLAISFGSTSVLPNSLAGNNEDLISLAYKQENTCADNQSKNSTS
jgi:hypothetical protein